MLILLLSLARSHYLRRDMLSLTKLHSLGLGVARVIATRRRSDKVHTHLCRVERKLLCYHSVKSGHHRHDVTMSGTALHSLLQPLLVVHLLMTFFI